MDARVDGALGLFWRPHVVFDQAATPDASRGLGTGVVRACVHAGTLIAIKASPVRTASPAVAGRQADERRGGVPNLQLPADEIAIGEVAVQSPPVEHLGPDDQQPQHDPLGRAGTHE